MKKLSLALVLLLCTLAISCRSNHKQAGKSSDAADRTSIVDSVSVLGPTGAIDRLKTGETCKLCDQELTSEEAIVKETLGDYTDASVGTPVRYSFYFPDQDIKQTDLVSKVMVRYNYGAVFNKVQQGYELFDRMSSGEEDSLTTRKDTLAWIAGTQPKISSELLKQVLPVESYRKRAAKLLAAYRNFNGVWTDDCPFAQARNEFIKGASEYPGTCPEDVLEDFKADFWDWYDKSKFVPEIDDIIRLNMGTSEEKATESQIEHLRSAVLSEKDIDRRAILALEYAKFDYAGGAVLLGEILEAGLYTRYLLETWLSWRTRVQMLSSPSSFGIIPNNYYDRLRAKCINTLLRHYQETSDQADLCFIENFVQAQILHRMGYSFGNQAMEYAADLSNWKFIHPRITNFDYLESE